MTKRKRCPICEKLFAPQGIKKHTNWCIRNQLRAADKATGITEAAMRPAHSVASQSSVPAFEPAASDTSSTHVTSEPDLFESIVRELKEANLGLVVITLE